MDYLDLQWLEVNICITKVLCNENTITSFSHFDKETFARLEPTLS